MRLKWSKILTSVVVGLLGFTNVIAVDWIYSARPGDNLWDLSDTYLERGVAYTTRLQVYNGIEDPYHILPGTPIRMPVRWLKLEPANAIVVETRGPALLWSGANTSRELNTGDVLSIGDRVTTGADASVTIEFADGSTLLLQSEAEVEMDALSAYSGTGMVDTQLRLTGGRVESRITPNTGPGSRFQIITPAATAAVRGTEFRVENDQNGASTRAEVLVGTIDVSNDDAPTRLPAGFGLIAQTGEALSEPKPLLPPPDLTGIANPQESSVLSLQWPAIAEAKSYRVQLFADSDFNRLLLDSLTEQPRVEWDAPADGVYFLRVRAIDADELEGLNATLEFVVNARPLPPSLLGPKPGALVHTEPPEFWWSVPSGISQFHLQVARDETFTDLLFDNGAVNGSRLTLSSLPPVGTYYWRLAAIDDQEGSGPFSVGSDFRVVPIPDAVSVGAQSDAESVTFTWSPAANTETYEFQLATDEAFSDLLIEETTTATELRLATPNQSHAYFRARGVSPDGVVGPYGPVNRVDFPQDPDYRPWLLLLIPLLLL